MLDAFENRSYPLEDLLERIDVPRDVSRNPLFDTMFIMQNMEQTQLCLDNITVESFPIDFDIAKFDITFIVANTDLLEYRIGYSSALYKKPTIERLFAHFTRILECILTNPDRKIAALDMLTPGEKDFFATQFNAPRIDYPGEQTIQQLFEAQVERTPDKIALVFEDTSLTYHTLNTRANQLARTLRNRGVGPEVMVGIMVDRSPEMMIAILGILKAGGAYVPIDPDYPPNRVGYMLEDSAARLLLTQSRYKESQDFNGDILCFDEAGIYAEDGSNLETVNTSTDLAYVIYTSGSTGTPKGVMINHRSVHNLVVGMTDSLSLTDRDSILCLTTISFDIFVVESYLALIKGMKVVIGNNESQTSPEMIKALIEQHALTMLQFTPSRLKLLQTYDPTFTCLTGIHKLLLGGEPFPDPLLHDLHQYYAGHIYNGYGPTEATVYTTIKDLSDTEDITIGTPISNVRTLIMDAGHMLLPVGIWGELCIAGDGLGMGYLNKEVLTGEKFITTTGIHAKEVTIYTTGDRARLLPNGDIEFGGRMDDQVKIRGFRIELGEIEAVIMKQPGIKASVVTVVERSGESNLCAYLLKETHDDIPLDTIRTGLARELPEYMIPAYIVFADHFPLTPAGKIDKKALPDPEALLETDAVYEAPRNKMEKTLVRIWREVLGIETIGINDNFFHLGGHSLKAISVTSKIKQHFHKSLSLRQLFKTPQIKALSEILSTGDLEVHHAVSPAQSRDYYPVSSQQRRLYALHQFEAASITYNMPWAFTIKGSLDMQRLHKACTLLLNTHEALRTGFEVVNGEPVQKIAATVPFTIEEETCGADEVHKCLEAFIRAYDLSRPPLFRVKVLRISPDDHILLLDMHHIISDGLSLALIVRDLAKAYNDGVLDEQRLHYKDYAVWQQEGAGKTMIQKQKRYWTEHLSDEIPVLDLPTDFPRPPVQRFEGDRLERRLPREIGDAVHALCTRLDVTEYMVFLALFTIMLAKYSGKEDVIVGTPVAGRDHADLESIPGMFVNTLPIRSRVAGTQRFHDYLMHVKSITLHAFENQTYPFEKLVEHVGVKRDLSRSPLFDCMFAMQKLDIGVPQFTGLQIGPYALDFDIAKFDLTFTVMHEDKVVLHSEYCRALYKEETIARLFDHYVRALHQVLADPFREINDIALITDEEHHRIMHEFNEPMTENTTDKTIHELFEAQAAKTPDAIALKFNEATLTYRELNTRANHLAHRLRDNGVGPGVIVALMSDRSLEMIIGIMGILKAGGAYLPIDPSYPENRITYMLEDSKTRIVVTRNKYREIISGRDLTLDLDDPDLYHGKTDNPEVITRPTDVAYVIYTSGSTGKPKGIMTLHANVPRIAIDTNYITIAPTDTILQLSNYAFDGSIFDIFGALLNGARLLLIPQADVLEINTISSLITNEQVSLFFCTTALFNLIVDFHVEALSTIRKILFGGERVSITHVKKAFDHLGPGRIIHVYGPTETTVFASFYPVDHIADTCDTIPIGKGVTHTGLYVCDAHNYLMPIGVPGELCITGEGLARGYLERPELTASRFVTLSKSAPGNDSRWYDKSGYDRMYRTGDLCRVLPDGNIDFLGRIDNQVKIRGHRIEPGEIENVIKKQEGVKACVVVVREKEGQKSISAYPVMNGKRSPDELRRDLMKELPEYMLPAYFMPLDELPLTPNGKVDLRALPEPEEGIDRGTEYEGPRNEREEELTRIFREVLGIERIGINDDFFALGGDSLKAIRIITHVNDMQAGSTLYIKDLFVTPTIKGLAASITDINHDRQNECPPDVAVVEYRDELVDTRFLKTTHTHLFQEIILGNEKPLDTASITYPTTEFLDSIGISPDIYINRLMGGKPLLMRVFDTNQGRIGLIVLPIMNTDLYIQRDKTTHLVIESLKLAKKAGARLTSLTGIIPSATDYGRDIQALIKGRSDVTPITTGHAVTGAAIFLNMEELLTLTRRSIHAERVGFLGLGSVGQTVLNLIFALKQFPREIILCDIYKKEMFLHELKAMIQDTYGYTGKITVLGATRNPPADFYRSSFIVGATNVPDILEVERLESGTILIDDSGPFCFNERQAIERLRSQGDILFKEAGSLTLPEPYTIITQVLHKIPPHLNDNHKPDKITGCVFSSIVNSIPPTVGEVQTDDCVAAYHYLKSRGIKGSDMSTWEYTVDQKMIDAFIKNTSGEC